jgi:hypothetical protein
MPRRDVVLTAMAAFGAGVAVGANWKELRKKIGPVLEKLGLKIADLGDFLSSAKWEGFTAPPPSRPVRKAKAKKTSRKKAPQAKALRNGSHSAAPRLPRRKTAPASTSSTTSLPSRTLAVEN